MFFRVQVFLWSRFFRVQVQGPGPGFSNSPFKYYKEDFRTNPNYHLLNPTRSYLEKISKIILDKINNELCAITQCNSWNSSKAIIEWFNDMNDKNNCSFSAVDTQEFHPYITEKLTKCFTFRK